VSNKRNPRRGGQQVRAEVSRKPVKVTKAMGAFVASQAEARERKERLRYWQHPTKVERRERELRVRRMRLGRRGNLVQRKPRKRRTNTGLASHELDN
jgi:hypothetical protein